MSKTMHEHSGIENLLASWMTSVFGQWKGVAMSVMFSLTVLLGILVIASCCIIPCVRGLLVKVMARVPNPGWVEGIYQMNLEPIEWGRE